MCLSVWQLMSSEILSVSEGRGQNLLGVGFRGVEGGTNASLTQHRQTMRKAENLLDLGGDQQHGNAGGGELANQAVNFDLGANVDPPCWFVDDEQSGSTRQPLG